MKKIFKVVTALMISFTVFFMTILFVCPLGISYAAGKKVVQSKLQDVKDMKITICGYSGTYTGKVTNSKPNGYGEFKYVRKNNDFSFYNSINGTWKNGVLVGNAKKICYDIDSGIEDRDEYIGNFVNLELNGQGQDDCYFMGELHSVTKGSFKNGYQNGYCVTSVYKNGKVSLTYSGNYKDGNKIASIEDYKKIKIGMELWKLDCILGYENRSVISNKTYKNNDGSYYAVSICEWTLQDNSIVSTTLRNNNIADPNEDETQDNGYLPFQNMLDFDGADENFKVSSLSPVPAINDKVKTVKITFPGITDTYSGKLVNGTNTISYSFQQEDMTGTYKGNLVNGKPEGYGVFKTLGGLTTHSLIMEGTWKGDYVTNASLTRIFGNQVTNDIKVVEKGDFINFKLEGNAEVDTYLGDEMVSVTKGYFKNGEKNGYCITTEYFDGKVSCVYDGDYKDNFKILTLADYDKIQVGMDYQKVKQILGNEGDNVDSGDSDTDEDIETYKWALPENNSIVVAFKNDKVIEKSQTGLK